MRRKSPITPREQQVLCLLAELHTYKDIGSKLRISISTVYDYTYKLMRKTGQHKKELLIKYAIEHGYGRKEISA